MHRQIVIFSTLAALLAGCDQPASEPPKVDVNVTIEQKEAPKKPAPKDERGTVIGNSEGFYRP